MSLREHVVKSSTARVTTVDTTADGEATLRTDSEEDSLRSDEEDAYEEATVAVGLEDAEESHRQMHFAAISPLDMTTPIETQVDPVRERMERDEAMPVREDERDPGRAPKDVAQACAEGAVSSPPTDAHAIHMASAAQSKASKTCSIAVFCLSRSSICPLLPAVTPKAVQTIRPISSSMSGLAASGALDTATARCT